MPPTEEATLRFRLKIKVAVRKEKGTLFFLMNSSSIKILLVEARQTKYLISWDRKETFPCFAQPCREVLESLNKHAHPQTSDLLLSTTCESICSCICQLG